MQTITKKIALAFCMAVLLLKGYAGEPVTRQFQNDEQARITSGKLMNTLNGNRNGTAFHEQMLPLSGSSNISHDFTDDLNIPMTSFAADDFVVPDGDTWTVHYVNFIGTYFSYTNIDVDAYNIFFYEDNDGLPGDLIQGYENITQYNTILIDEIGQTELIEATLSTPVTFTEGHYWLSVQAVSDGSVTGFWGWAIHQNDATLENEYAWKNPGDGFQYGFIDWTPGSMISFGSLNLAFGLYGEGQNNDLAMSSIINPTTGGNLTASEQVTVKIKNEGTTTVSGFNVSFQVNNGSVVTENTGSLAIEPNKYAQYTFTQTADLSASGEYQITAFLNNSNDPVNGNDTTSTSVFNLGEVYIMPATGTQEITTCGASWTDSGGLNGNIGMNDDAVTTIYPANAGDRIRLSFLEFDASYGGFLIYNGTSIDAPLIGEYSGTTSPGIVEALNDDGALTIHFMGPGWEETTGWVAYISCVTPLANDFAMLSFSGDLLTVFEGNTMQLNAHVRNLGSTVQNPTVTFSVNGASIGSFPVGNLNPYDTITLSTSYTFNTPGEYLLNATLSEDLDNSNNSISFSRTAYAFDAFFEDFELGEFPPADWSSGGQWARSDYSAYSGLSCAEIMISSGFSDTLVTSRVDIDADASLAFYASSSLWWPGALDILFFDEDDNTWHFVETPILPANTYGNFNIDMSQFVGKTGRIGFRAYISDPFAWSGLIDLDLIIGNNITAHYDDYDLSVRSLTGPFFFYANQPTEYTVKVNNLGLNTIAEGVYNVQIIQEGTDEILASIPGQEIDRDQEIIYNIPVNYTEVGAFNIYGKIDFSDYYLINNTTAPMAVAGLADNSEVTESCNEEALSYQPFNLYYNYSLMESVYTPDIIGETGPIFGMALEYTLNKNAETPVRIWIDTTTMTELTDFIPSTNMTLVYSGDLQYIKGAGNLVYIPFNTPFYYDGTTNVVILFEKAGTGIFTNTNFKSSIMQGNTSMVYESDTPTDPENPEWGFTTNINPCLKLVFNDYTGTASGNISDLNGASLEDVAVVVEPLNIITYTDEQGSYTLPYIPAGSYSTKASKFGYIDETKTLTVASSQNTVLDFELTMLGTAIVNGTIEGNDLPGTGIEGAEIKLTGYSEYTTTSDASGEFSIPGVYLNNGYLMTITAEGYEVYSETIDVNEDLSLGTITLTEAMSVAGVVTATENSNNEMEVSWNTPTTSAFDVISFDDGIHSDGYAGEATEQVWLGNFFPFNEPATILSFDVKFVRYGISEAFTTKLGIFSGQGELIYESENFQSNIYATVNVDVPNFTLEGNYYVMLYYNISEAQSDYLAFDSLSVTTPNYATYYYDGGAFDKLSNLTGVSGSFLIHANVVTDTDRSVNTLRQVLDYEVRFGNLTDLQNAGNWPLLGTVNQNSYTDQNWPPASIGKYLYSVRTNYTTGESDFSFSNLLNFDPTSTQMNKLANVKIYPNPSTDYIIIETEPGSEMFIFDMSGRLLDQKRILTSSYKADMSRFEKGTLMMVIENEGSIHTEKVTLK